jgi:hypothetical protein
MLAAVLPKRVSGIVKFIKKYTSRFGVDYPLCIFSPRRTRER